MEEERLGVLFPGAKRFELEASIVSISVMAENKLATVDLISQAMKLDEAQAVTEQVCAAFDVPTTGLAEFMALVKEARTNPAAAPKDSPRSWTSFHIKRAGFNYGISCMPYAGWDFTFAKIYISAQFYEKGKPMRFLTEPIKPPHGFENVSLDRVPKALRAPSWMKPITGTDLERGKEQWKAIQEAHQKSQANFALPLAPHSEVPNAAPDAPPPDKSSNYLLWIAGAITALASLMFVLRRKKPKA